MTPESPTAAAAPSRPKRAVSLGVIFLTLVIDLIGFSIIFPLGPHLFQYYLDTDGQSGMLHGLLQVLQLSVGLCWPAAQCSVLGPQQVERPRA